MKVPFAERLFATAIAAAVAWAVSPTACAQSNYAVDWHTLDGGGGTSTNSAYSITGTIGQPDAGAVLTDGFYRVDSGFWSVVAAITTPGVPVLTITRDGPDVIIAWPYPSSGFGLQRSAALVTSNWAYLTNVPTQVSGQWQLTVPVAGNQFYRLALHASADTVFLPIATAVITSPFVITNGVLYQPFQTTLAGAGRAALSFNLGNAGIYVIDGVVNAVDDGANSFYVNVDAEPQDPLMIWDVPLTSGFEQRPVSWRGEGGVPKIFGLTRGAHQIVIRGREAYALLQRLTVTPYP